MKRVLAGIVTALVINLKAQNPTQVTTFTFCAPPPTCHPCEKGFGLDSLQKLFQTSGIRPGVIIGQNAVDTTNLVTQATFNTFVAQKVAFYLSGSQDLSLYDNFSLADVTTGRLTVGHNCSKKNDEGKISYLITMALQTNIANDFATLFSNKSFSDETGASLKFTKMLSGSTFINFTQPQKEAFNRERYLHYCKMEALAIAARQQCYQIPCDTGAQRQFADELEEKNIADFYDFEIGKLQDMRPLHGYKNFFTHWWSIQTYIPFTEKKYSVANDTSFNFNDHRYYNWSVMATYAGAWETRGGTLFYNFSYKGFLNNTIEAQDTTIAGYTKASYAPVKNTGSSLVGDSKQVYIGKYRDFYTHSVIGSKGCR